MATVVGLRNRFVREGTGDRPRGAEKARWKHPIEGQCAE
jgi:hypothetical protein